MGRKERAAPEEEPSLLPSVGEREEELNRMLLEARTEAERTIEEARRKAASVLEAAKKAIPRKIGRKRDEAMARIETEVAGLREALEGEVNAFELVAERNVERAANFIVSAVWPKGE